VIDSHYSSLTTGVHVYIGAYPWRVLASAFLPLRQASRRLLCSSWLRGTQGGVLPSPRRLLPPQPVLHRPGVCSGCTSPWCARGGQTLHETRTLINLARLGDSVLTCSLVYLYLLRVSQPKDRQRSRDSSARSAEGLSLIDFVTGNQSGVGGQHRHQNL